MITDAHMHIGEFPMFGVGLDPSRRGEHLAAHGISTEIVFAPDNAATAKAVTETTGGCGLVWANPKYPDAVADARDFLSAPEFRGLKLHPLLDGYPPMIRRCGRRPSWPPSAGCRCWCTAATRAAISSVPVRYGTAPGAPPAILAGGGPDDQVRAPSGGCTSISAREEVPAMLRGTHWGLDNPG